MILSIHEEKKKKKSEQEGGKKEEKLPSRSTDTFSQLQFNFQRHDHLLLLLLRRRRCCLSNHRHWRGLWLEFKLGYLLFCYRRWRRMLSFCFFRFQPFIRFCWWAAAAFTRSTSSSLISVCFLLPWGFRWCRGCCFWMWVRRWGRRYKPRGRSDLESKWLVRGGGDGCSGGHSRCLCKVLYWWWFSFNPYRWFPLMGRCRGLRCLDIGWSWGSYWEGYKCPFKMQDTLGINVSTGKGMGDSDWRKRVTRKEYTFPRCLHIKCFGALRVTIKEVFSSYNNWQTFSSSCNSMIPRSCDLFTSIC